ncbi:MAG: hypothetical protein EBU08_21620 [Micrococcales bacterium]|nr:hypothetical protein [Micrococcales bacterium]
MRLLFFTCIAFLVIAMFTIFRSMVAELINSHTDLGLFVLLVFVCVILGTISTFIYELVKKDF